VPITDWRTYFRELAPVRVDAGVAIFPAPAVTSRDIPPVPVTYPSAVLKLAERAREAGWEVHQQYARGCGTHGATGRPLAERDTFALIFHSHPMTERRAYAVRTADTWKSVCVYGPDLPPVLELGVTELEMWLGQAALTGEEMAAWLAALLAGMRLDRNMRDVVATWRKRQAPKRASGARGESGG
jgi:hypothetical protein